MSIRYTREGILKYGLCVLVFFLPLVVFPNFFFYYISSKTFLMYGFLSILFPLWLYSLYIDESYRLSKRQLIFFTPVVIYVGWMTIAGILARVPHLAFWSSFERGTGLITIYFALAASFIVSSLIKKYGISYLYLLIKIILASSFILILSIWASNEGFNLPYQVFSNSGGGGLIGSSSISGPFLIFSVFLGIYLLISKEIILKCKVIVSVILAAILFSPSFINIYGAIFDHKSIIGSAMGSSMGILIGLGSIAIGYLILSKKIAHKILGILIIVASVFILFIGWNQMVTYGTDLNKKFMEVTAGNRIIFWDLSKKAINDHPYLGYGPENYYIAFQDHFTSWSFKDKTFNETTNDKAHNIYYDIVVAGGYPAFIFYVFVLMSIFYAIYRNYREDNISKKQALVLYGLFVAYVAQNLFFFDTNLTIFYFFLLIGVIFGFIDSKYIKIEDIKVIKKDNKILDTVIGPILIMLGGVLIIYFTILPSHKAILLQSVLSTPSTVDKSGIYNNLLQAHHVGDDTSIGAMADYVFKYVIYTDFKDEDFNAVKEDVFSFYKYLERVAQKNNNDLRLQIALLRFNSVYHSMTKTEVAKDSLSIINHAHKLSPEYVELYWWESEIYYWRGDNKKAIDSYKKAIAINPNIDMSHMVLIKFAKDIKDKKLYDEAMAQAVKDIPGFVAY